MSRTFRLTIRYDGTGYAGWQVQPGRQTIQGVIEEGLETILHEPCRLTGAGRTDAGVHALGQVAHFTTCATIPAKSLKRALNSILPRDIAIAEASVVHPGFHARRDAVAKRYRYRIFRDSTRDPFLWPYTWFIPHPLDIEAIRRCLPILRGEHDFSAFSVAKRDGRSGIRRLMNIAMVDKGGDLVIEFLGNGFLRKQVRRMVGTLIEVGRGRFTPDHVQSMLDSLDPAEAGVTAPPQGLFLVKVYYPARAWRPIDPAESSADPC
ncbi:MAG: tRNA pseudouridine(38-40) synthase TruA [bacterium]